MALALTKVWNFSSYRYANISDIRRAQAEWWLAPYTVLVALGWEVRGGCHSTGGLAHNTADAYGAWPGVDPWAGGQAVLNRQSGDFYIILRSPTGFEVCLGSNYASGNSTYGAFHFMFISHAAGFGSANGGANGTSGNSAVPPTATDQQQIYAHNTSSDNGMGHAQHITAYGAQSSDNLSTRLFIQRDRVIGYWLHLDHLNNAHANLDNGGRIFAHVITSADDGNDTVMSNQFYTSARYYGRVSGINRSLYAGTSGYANVGHQSLNIVQGDNKIVVAPMDMYNHTLSERGYYGTIPDCYWGNNTQHMQLVGDAIGGPANWFSGGSIVSPWDPAESMPRIH